MKYTKTKSAEKLELQDLDFVKEAYSLWAMDNSNNNKFRVKAKQCLELYSGSHWNNKQIEDYKLVGKNAIVYNLIAPIVDSAVGHEAGSRLEIDIKPRKDDDGAICEALKSSLEFFSVNGKSEIQDSLVFKDAFITGVGCGEIYLDTISTSERDINIIPSERVPVLDVSWDYQAKKANLLDASRVWRKHLMHKKDFYAKFPDADPDLYSITDTWLNDGIFSLDDNQTFSQFFADTNQNDNQPFIIGDSSSFEKNKKQQYCRVLEYQYYDIEKSFVVLNTLAQTDSEQEETFDNEKDAKKAVERLNIIGQTQAAEAGTPFTPAEYKPVNKKVYYRAFFIANKLLRKEQSPCQTGFTYFFMTGDYNEIEKRFYGKIENLIDPQLNYNKGITEAYKILSSTSRGGSYIEEDALPVGTTKFSTTPDGDTIVSSGANSQGKIMAKPTTQLPPILELLMQQARELVSSISGIDVATLGNQDSQPMNGYLDYAKKQSAINVLRHIFDSLQEMKKHRAKLFIYFLVSYITDEDIVEIVGQEQAPALIAAKQDPSKIKYSIVVSESPDSANQKDASFAIMNSIGSTLLKDMSPQVLSVIFELLPLPCHYTKKIQAAMASNQPSPQEIQQGQEQLQKLQAENQQLKTGLEKEQMKSQALIEAENIKAQSITEVAQIKAESDKLIADTNNTMKAILAKLEDSRFRAIADQEFIIAEEELAQNKHPNVSVPTTNNNFG
jgi:hypothetical protein